MSGGAGPSKKPKTYYFHTEWEENFFFTMSYSKCTCLICQSSLAIPKKGNVARHFRAFHKNYDTDFPLKSELRRKKVRELKCKLFGRQPLFPESATKAKAAAEASFRMSHFVVKHKKCFQDGEMVKEAFLGAADSLFRGFENKPEILSSIRALQLSRSMVTWHCEVMAEDLTRQLWKDIVDCESFSLQLAESTGVHDAAQLCIFIRMVFTDMTAKEELLAVLPMKEHMQGEDIFEFLKNFMEKTKLPVDKLVSITTDGAPAMVDHSNGFIAKCREDDTFPEFLSYHCIIHQQTLCAKMLNMSEIMEVAMRIGCSIHARSLQRRLFPAHLEEADGDLSELLLNTDVRWFSRGKFLQRFRDLYPEIKEFLHVGKHAEYDRLNDDRWLLDLAFLTDLTNMLSGLNVELQGKDRTVIQLISSVNSFKRKMRYFSSKLQRHDLANFKNLASELETQGKACGQLDVAHYTEQIENCLSEFDQRFQDFALLEPVATFMCYPFRNDADVESLASKIQKLFHLNFSEVEDEILTLQADIQLKSRAQGQFWNLLTEDKYPNMKKCALALTALFGSTYLCESALSHMKIIKSKCRCTMNDDHLEVCLRLAISNYCPDYASLADSVQCKSSE